MKAHLFIFTQITLILIVRFNTTAEKKKTSGMFNGIFTCKLRAKGQCDADALLWYTDRKI